MLPGILAAIKAGQPDQAAGAAAAAAGHRHAADDIAILSHRIAASYRAEGRDAEAYQLAISVSPTPAVPQLMWDAGFAAYRLGDWANADSPSGKAGARTRGAQNSLRAQGAFWAARAHMQSGDPQKVVTLLNFAAEERAQLLRPDRRTHAGHRHPDRLFRCRPQPGRFHTT